MGIHICKTLITDSHMFPMAPNTHKQISKNTYNKLQDSTHTHAHAHTPKLSSISGFKAVPPSSPWLFFWLCLHAGRRSPDTHHWVSSLHINATYSPIKSPICAFLLFLQHQSSYKIQSLCIQAHLKVNHASSRRFFFFPNIRCCVCDCALFSSKCRLTQKPVEAYSMFQDHT